MAEKKGKKAKDSKGNGEDKELKDKMDGGSPGEAEEKNAESSAESKKTDEEVLRELQEEIDKLTSKDIIIQMMMSLSSLAYKKMGIPAGVNDKYKDMLQAKLAVDSFDALLKVIEDEINAAEKENLKSSLANLQLNFVKVFP